MDTWASLIVHEIGAWSPDGLIRKGKRGRCRLNREVLRELIRKHGPSIGLGKRTIIGERYVTKNRQVIHRPISDFN